jgi:hypothetical protein
MSLSDWTAGATRRYTASAVALVVASVLSGSAVGFLSESSWARVMGVAFMAFAIWFGVSHLRRAAPLHLAVIPALPVLVLFGYRVLAMEPPFVMPRFHLAGVLAWGAVAVIGLLTTLRVRGRPAFLAAYALAGAVFAADLLMPEPELRATPWEATWYDDPAVGVRYQPHSTAMSFYPDNPRGYFEQSDGWSVEVHHGSVGRLERVGTDPSHLRVTIPQRIGWNPWEVKLQWAPLQVYIGRSYQVHFEARADTVREITCSVGQNHAPWELVSPYRHLELAEEWQDYACSFVATDNEPDARLFFDVGQTDVPFEMRNVTISDLSRQLSVAPPERFFVTYRFDRLGSRGADRVMPPPPEVARIVVLGDSYAMGVGVHEEHTLSHRLEGLLNLRRLDGESRYAVVNGAVTGFDTRQARALYDTQLHWHEPKLVLLVMSYDDDMSAAEAEEGGYALTPPRLSRLVTYVERALAPRRPFDYSRSIEEVKALAESVGARGQRLAVVIFRGDSFHAWEKLARDLAVGLEGTGVPVLDLGPVLLGSAPPEGYRVHENDPHYNEVAHRLAAEEIERFLRVQQLIPIERPVAAAMEGGEGGA